MVIVVEGIDRVGKTTLCKRLSTRTGYKILKKEREFVSGIDKNQDAYINYGNAMGIAQLVNNGLADNFIIDRFNWTEAVYGYIDRKNISSFYLMDKVGTVIRSVKDKWIFVYVEPTDLKMSSIQHGSDLKSHLIMYEDIVMKSYLQHLLKCNYNTIDKCVDEVIEIIKGEWKNER